MTDQIDRILKVLSTAGFRALPKPMLVGGQAFDFDAAARGTSSSHDIVVIGASSASHALLERLIVALAMTLDLHGSRRPLTVVLVGDNPSPELRRNLERHGRVLQVPETATEEDVEQGLNVLLPLRLPKLDSRGPAPLEEVFARLGPSASPEHERLIDAAKAGTNHVREQLRAYIDDGAKPEQGGSQ